MEKKHAGGWRWLAATALTLAMIAAISYDLVLAESANAAPVERDGAAMYALYCTRCHIDRYPRERTDAQWKTIMFHMRTRAQIPYADSEAILKFLQQSN